MARPLVSDKLGTVTRVAFGRTDDELVEWARSEARRLLDPVGTRLAHMHGVSRRAERAAAALPDEDRSYLIAAAHLHDIGHAPQLVQTGLHAVDGARYLRSIGVPARLCNLVAHHSYARIEAEERGLAGMIADFNLEDGPVMDALIYADMTTGPNGERMTFAQRFADILRRYPEDHPVHRANVRARPLVLGAIRRTLSRLELRADLSDVGRREPIEIVGDP